jgi:outer membrane protein TolC
MTEVTLANGPGPCSPYTSAGHLLAIQQFASNPQQKESKRLIIFTWLGETAPSMASADRRSLQRPRQSPSLRPLNFRTVLLLISLSVFLPATLRAQAPTVNRDSSSTTSSSSGSTQAPISQPAISQVQTSLQNPVFGSVPEAKPTPGILALTFIDAIDRALRQNLAGLLSQYNTIEARGEKWQQLSDLLPNINADVQEVTQKESLEALGLRSGGPFGKVPAVIGPFSYFDVRASATQRVFDWKAIQKYRSSVIGENVAKFNLKDARDLVVLATGNAYLQAIAGAAREQTAQAQVETAKALYDKAVAQQQAGVAPAIDTLRAQVEYQTRQQQLIAATNDFAKQKITLARVIGLAPRQEFELIDKTPYRPFPIPDLETSVQRAYAMRSDYKAAHERLVAAQLERSAATAGYFPTVDLAVNYGEIGKTPGDVLPTYFLSGTLNIPIFQGGKVHGDVLKAEASLRQAQAQMADIRALIDQDIRNALLDLKSSNDQVEVAQSSVNLAEQALTQSQDRFSAGVTDNLEVVQAQEALASAHENLISSMYFNNLAKVSFARALGRAEDGVREYLKGK